MEAQLTSRQDGGSYEESQGQPTDRFGGISVRKTCNRFKFSVREMPARAFLVNAFCFRRDKNDVLSTKTSCNYLFQTYF